MQKVEHASGVIYFDLFQWTLAPKQPWLPVHKHVHAHIHTAQEKRLEVDGPLKTNAVWPWLV